MNNQKQSSKKSIIIVIVVALVAGVGYFYYSGSKGTDSASMTASTISADTQAVGARILSLLNQIQNLKIDTTVFDDQKFKSLIDYTVAIPQQNVGRPNPFAPIPGVSPSSNATQRR